MLASPGRGTKRPMECLGLCRAGLGWLPRLGLEPWRPSPNPLVAWFRMMVVEQPLAGLPDSLVGQTPFPPC